MASWTNCLTAGSPQAPSVPRPKPPPNPLTPAKPTPRTSQASPSSRMTPASVEDLPRPRPAWPDSKSWLPSTATIGNLRGGRQLLGQDVGLLGQAVVGQVAAEGQHVRFLGDPLEEAPEGAAGGLGAVEVGDRRQADDVSDGLRLLFRHRWSPAGGAPAPCPLTPRGHASGAASRALDLTSKGCAPAARIREAPDPSGRAIPGPRLPSSGRAS